MPHMSRRGFDNRADGRPAAPEPRLEPAPEQLLENPLELPHEDREWSGSAETARNAIYWLDMVE